MIARLSVVLLGRQCGRVGTLLLAALPVAFVITSSLVLGKVPAAVARP